MRLTPVIALMLLSVPFLTIKSSLHIPEPISKPISVIEVIKWQPKTKAPKIARSLPAIPHDGDELECLAKNVYFEARGEPSNGQVAVAHVTYNRKRVMKMESLCDAVYHKAKGTCAFSWVCQGYSTPKQDSAWDRAMRISESFLKGSRSAVCAGIEKALYFHSVDVSPAWAAERAFICQIGNHLFYK